MRNQQSFPRWSLSRWIGDYIAKGLRTGLASSRQRAIAGALLLLPVYAFALWIGGIGPGRPADSSKQGLFSAQAGPVVTAIPANNALQADPIEVPSSGSEPSHLSESFLSEYDRFASQENDLDPESASPASSSPVGLTSKLMLALLLVVGGVYGAQWVVRRSRNSQATPLAGWNATSLQIRESKDLAAGQKLHLVQYGDEILLLGATAQHISLLARYPKESGVEDFADHLAATVGLESSSPSGDADTPVVSGVDDLPSLEESLERLRQSHAGAMGGPHA